LLSSAGWFSHVGGFADGAVTHSSVARGAEQSATVASRPHSSAESTFAPRNPVRSNVK